MEDTDPVAPFDVGVAIAGYDAAGEHISYGSAPPAYEEASGRRVPRPRTGHLAASVRRGDEAVQAATEAIAAQVVLAADRIAGAVQAHSGAEPAPGELGLESVEVSFGITLATGVQALFTAQAQSSAQVTIVLARRPQAPH